MKFMKNMGLKILCLGNEFIKQDSLAKKIGKKLRDSFEVVDIKNSFQLIDILKEDKSDEFVILDVIEGLNKVRILDIDDLQENKILTAHDFDAGIVLKLLKPNVKIVGMPMQDREERIDESQILREVKEIINSF